MPCFSYGRGAWMCILIYFSIFFIIIVNTKIIAYNNFFIILLLIDSIINSNEINTILSLDNPLSGRIYLYNSIMFSLKN